MKLGVRAHDYGKFEASKLASKLKAEGFESVQLAIPRAIEGINSFEEITERKAYEIREAFEKQNIEIGIMSCYQDLGNPNPAIRSNALETFIKCLKINKTLGAKAVGTETCYSHLSKIEKTEWFPYMLDSLLRIAEVAEHLDTDFAIEPVAWHPLCDVETTREVIDKIGSEHVKVIFDLANVLENPKIICQKEYWKHCFDILGDYIVAIHLKDFSVDDGRYIALPLGKGCLDYSMLIDFLKKNPQIPVMREEIMMESATEDILFMKKML